MATSALAIALALAMAPRPTAAQNWTGTTSRDWTDGGNWSGGVPTTGNVSINATANDPVLGGSGAATGSTGDLIVGNTNTATLTVQNGSTLTAGGTVFLGYQSGSVGTLTIDNSTVTNNSYVAVGDRTGTTGEIIIRNRGKLTTTGATFGAIVGNLTGATGTATITGAGSQWTSNQTFHVGRFGTGTVDIDNAGTVTALNGTSVATESGASGTLNVNAGTLETTVLTRGAGTTASVTFDNGTLRALADSTNFVRGFNSGEIDIVGSGLIFDSQTFNVVVAQPLAGTGGLTKGGTGMLTLTGTNAFSGGLTVNAGTMAIGGGGSVSTGETRVGSAVNGANGTLNVVGGSTLSTTGRATVGGLQSPANWGIGTVTVDGPGSQWDVSGVLFLAYRGNNTTTELSRGTLTVSNGGAVSVGSYIAIGDLNNSQGTLRVESGGTLTTAGDVMIGNYQAAASGQATVTGAGSAWAINGSGGLSVGQTGTGALTIDNGGTVTAQSGTTVARNSGSSGTLDVTDSGGASGVLETFALTRGAGNAQVTIDGGTLRATATNTTNFISGFTGTGFDIATGGMSLDTNGFDVRATAQLSGAGALGKIGGGTLTLSGANTFAGGLNIGAGTVAAGTVTSAFGAGTVDVALNATVDITGFDTTVSGIAGLGSIVLGGNTLTVDQATGTASTFDGVISGAGGGLTKAGAGTLTLTGANSYAGATQVDSGTLQIEGTQTAGGLTTVASGATLAGSGALGGSVTVANGGTLLAQSDATGPRALDIDGDLTLTPGSNLTYAFGADPGADPNGLIIDVGGHVDLGGATLNVTGSNFDPGVYGLIQYGTMSGSFGSLNIPTDFYVQTAIAGRISLVNTTGLGFNFWDGAGNAGNGMIDGGDGVWQGSGSGANHNWIEATGQTNGPFQGGLAIFGGTAGRVTVDNSEGAVSVSGMQFVSDGYFIDGATVGDAITLTGTSARISVGDRNNAVYTATIDAILTGGAELVKDDAGTLVLTAANQYAGGTRIEEGTLQISSDGNLGVGGTLTLAGGTLQNTTTALATSRTVAIEAAGGTFQTDVDLTLDGTVGGDGALTKRGAGTLTLNGSNGYRGGTVLDRGAVQISAGDNLGTGAITFNNNSTLAITAGVDLANTVTVNPGGGTIDTGGFDLALAGAVSGAGALAKTDGGDLILTADSTGYTGTLTVSGGNLSFGNGGADGRIAGDVVLTDAGNGLILDRSDDFAYAGVISGAGTVTQRGGGTTTLTGNNAYQGLTTISGGTLQVGDGGTSGTLGSGGVSLGNGGKLVFNHSGAVAYADTIDGDGSVTQAGSGTLTLSNTGNGYTGGTFLDAGTLAISDSGSLGSGALTFDGGRLENTGESVVLANDATFASAGTILTGSGTTLSLDGVVGGTGTLTKTGTGTLVLGNAGNNYGGGTNIDAGTVQVSAGGSLGSGGIAFNGGTLATTAALSLALPVTVNGGGGALATAGDLALSGLIAGAGAFTKGGTGDLVLTADSVGYTGTLTVSGGSLKFGAGGAGGSITGDVALANATNGLVFDRSGNFTYGGLISGAGFVTQRGSGVVTLKGDNVYGGATTIMAGMLDIDGDQSAATGLTTVTGGTLRGDGIIGGAVTVGSGGTLTSYDDNTDGINKLAIKGDLGLAAGASLDYRYGLSPNDDRDALMVEVGGDLDLGGATLNVYNVSGSDFAPGVYGLIHYAGTRSGNLMPGAMPSNDFSVQTAIAGRVNLVNTAGMNLEFWNGSGASGIIAGGDGDWQASAGNHNWASEDGTANGPYADGSFAIFGGQGGTVQVDDSLGQVSVSSVQFTADDYVIQGDAITLAPDTTTDPANALVTVILGDRTLNGAEYEATIESVLQGDATLVKDDLGTLVLKGVNTYGRGTIINAGTLAIEQDANLGAAGTLLTIEGGTLQNTAAFSSSRPVALLAGGGTFQTDADLTLAGAVGGTDALTKTGLGKLTLTGANTYAGGTVVVDGVLSVSSDAHLGAAAGRLTLAGGTLENTAAFSSARSVTLEAGGGTFKTDADLTLAGVLDGGGGLVKTGTGRLDLAAANHYTGPTTVMAGTLAVNGSITSTVTVAAPATLGGTGMIAGDVTNSGTIAPGNSIGTLTIAGDYVGREGALYAAEAVLGGDDSPADGLVVQDGIASGSTTITVTNLGGAGALTTGNGIPLVATADGGTTTADAFELAGPVAAGPYEYLLFRGDRNGAGDGWYLRSEDTQPQPSPVYRPEAAAYAAVPGLAWRLGLATLGTYRERSGDEGLPHGAAGSAGAGGAPDVWARVIAQKTRREHGGVLEPRYDGTIAGVQMGADIVVLERAGGMQDRFGVLVGYGRAHGDVTGFALGEEDYLAGRMDLTGYSLGATWTRLGASGWYANAALMSMLYDGKPKSTRGVSAHVDGSGIVASLEGGYPVTLDSGLILEPQAQLVWQSSDFDRTQDRFSAIEYRTPDAFAGRLGLRLAGDVASGSALVQPSLTVSLWREVLDREETVFSGTALSAGGRNATSLETAAGISVRLGRNVGLWGSMSYLTDVSGPEQRVWRGILGVRAMW